MGIVSITTDVAGQVGNMIGGVVPRRVKIVSTDNLGTVEAAGYLNPDVLQGYSIYPTDIIDMWYGARIAVGPSIISPGTYAVFIPSIVNGVITLGLASANLSGPADVITNVASATPGTVRSLSGTLNETATTMTSGNVVGVRGSVNMVGNSGAYIYGVEGKIVPTGSITNTGGGFEAGVLGQFDISAATISTSGAYMAPIWGDYGSTATSGTYTQCYGLAMTNSTAAILGGQVYLYGGASALLHLVDNNGLVGVTYFKTSGTSAGSWGNATPPTPSKVLTVSVNGTLYYLPLVAQNT